MIKKTLLLIILMGLGNPGLSLAQDNSTLDQEKSLPELIQEFRDIQDNQGSEEEDFSNQLMNITPQTDEDKEAVRDLLNDNDYIHIKTALRMLGNAKDTESETEIIDLLGDSQAAGDALAALVAIEDGHAVDIVLQDFPGDKGGAQLAAQIGAAGLDRLAELAGQSNGDALAAIAMMKDQAAVPQLQGLLGDTNPDVRLAASKALAAMNIPENKVVFQDQLRDADPEVRCTALEYLLQVDEPTYYPVAIRWFDHCDDYSYWGWPEDVWRVRYLELEPFFTRWIWYVRHDHRFDRHWFDARWDRFHRAGFFVKYSFDQVFTRQVIHASWESRPARWQPGLAQPNHVTIRNTRVTIKSPGAQRAILPSLRKNNNWSIRVTVNNRTVPQRQKPNPAPSVHNWTVKSTNPVRVAVPRITTQNRKLSLPAVHPSVERAPAPYARPARNQGFTANTNNNGLNKDDGNNTDRPRFKNGGR